MKKIIDFVKGWRQPGDPWSVYLFAPLGAAILIFGLIVMIPTYVLLRLLGFSNDRILNW